MVAPTPAPETQPNAPFAGLVVIDLTQIYNGPYATFLLAQAGATVIKVEPPRGEHLVSCPSILKLSTRASR